MTDRARPPEGIRCPCCGRQTYVRSTTRPADGVVRRNRWCPRCRAGAWTEERVVGDWRRTQQIPPGD